MTFPNILACQWHQQACELLDQENNEPLHLAYQVLTPLAKTKQRNTII